MAYNSDQRANFSFLHTQLREQTNANSLNASQLSKRQKLHQNAFKRPVSISSGIHFPPIYQID